MRQTRGAIKFLIAAYKAILKHAYLAFILSSALISNATAKTYNISSDDYIDSGDQYSLGEWNNFDWYNVTENDIVNLTVKNKNIPLLTGTTAKKINVFFDYNGKNLWSGWGSKNGSYEITAEEISFMVTK